MDRQARPEEIGEDAAAARSRAALGPVLVLVLVSTLLELVLLASPGRETTPAWVLAEERQLGNVAQELARGPLLELQDYQFDTAAAGSLVVAVLAVPFVWLLGPTLPAIRLPSVLFSAGIVALVFLALDRFAGRRAAWIGGLLCAIPSPGYSLVAITAWGAHSEASLFVLACALALLGGTSAGPRARGSALLAGVLAGLGTCFLYTFLVALAVLLLLKWAGDREFFRRRTVGWFAAGYLVGLGPWIRYNLSHDFGGLYLYESSLLGVLDPSAIPRRVVLFFGELLPFSLHFRGMPLVDGRALEWAVYATLALLFAVAAWRLRRSVALVGSTLVGRRPRGEALQPSLLFLAYPVAFAAAYAVTDVGQLGFHTLEAPDIAEARLATSVYPFLVMAAAVGLVHLWDVLPRGRALAIGLTALLCLSCAVGTLSICDLSRFGSAWRAPGTSEMELVKFIGLRYADDLGRLERIVTRLEESRSEREQHRILFGLGQHLKRRVLVWSEAEGRLVERPARTEAQRTSQRQARAALSYLRDRVAAPFEPYFADPFPGERLYTYAGRESFWEDRRAHHVGEAVEAASALR